MELDLAQQEKKEKDIHPSAPSQEKPKKVQHAERVALFDAEYHKLVLEHGESIVIRAIERLDAYKLEHGRVYKSDAGALRSWAIRAAYKDASEEQERALRLARLRPPAGVVTEERARELDRKRLADLDREAARADAYEKEAMHG